MVLTMSADTTLILTLGGLVSGVLAGFLGIGGGTVLVPLMVAVGFTSQQAVGTSSLAILVTALSGSVQNWRMGYLSLQRVILLGLPAIVTAQIGAFAAGRMTEYVQLTAFGILLVSNVYLAGLRKQVTAQQRLKEAELDSPPASGDPMTRDDQTSGDRLKATAETNGSVHSQSAKSLSQVPSPGLNPVVARVFTGGTAGLLAGLFGVGGGVIMVPLQILLLGEKIKTAVQTSLGVIVITAISASIGHALANNVVFSSGLILGAGGLVGVQISTRFLPKLSDRLVSFLFRTMLAVLSVYIFWQAWQSYSAQV
ncbi:MAG: sulfite exporter TauE/SafE family protein [Cyanobacteria bacterium J06639_16]